MAASTPEGFYFHTMGSGCSGGLRAQPQGADNTLLFLLL